MKEEQNHQKGSEQLNFLDETTKEKANEKEKEPKAGWVALFRLRRILEGEHGKFKAEIRYFDHHLTHQLYAEAMRDWDDYVSLSYDGGGESISTLVNVVNNGHRHEISRHYWPNSLGHFYATFTGFLGFKMLEGEYKMMGLAPYGEPKYKNIIYNTISLLKVDS